MSAGVVVRERRVPHCSSRDSSAELLTAVRRSLDIDGASPVLDFLATIIGWDHGRATLSTRRLAAHLGIRASTLNSRTFRLGLPSTKAVIDGVVLVRVAGLRQRNPKASVNRIALDLYFSSSQHLGRYARRLRGQSAGQWLENTTAEAEITRFVEAFVMPYREQWRQLNLRPSEASR